MADNAPIRWDDAPIKWDQPALPASTHGAVQWDQPDPVPGTLHEQNPWMDTVGHYLSGQFIREGATSLTGVDQFGNVGAKRVADLATVDRTRGVPLAAARGESEPGRLLSQAAQFGANFTAGAAGLVGGLAMFPMELVAAGGRELAEAAARGILPLALPKDLLEKEWFLKELESGRLSWDAHGRRIVARSTAGAEAFVQALNPTLTAFFTAKGENGDPPTMDDRVGAATEAFYAFPVESLALPFMLTRGLGRMGGKPYSHPILKYKGGETVSVPLKTLRRGKYKPLKLNRFGKAMFKATPESLQSIVWDIEAPKATVMRGLKEHIEEASPKGKPSDRTVRALESVLALHEDIAKEVGEWDRLAAEKGVKLSPWDKAQLVNMKAKWTDMEILAPAVDGATMKARGTLATALRDLDLRDEGVVADLMSRVDMMVPRVVDKNTGQLALVKGRLGQMLGEADVATPLDVYKHMTERIAEIAPEDRQVWARALETEAKRLASDPEILALSAKHYRSADGSLEFVPTDMLLNPKEAQQHLADLFDYEFEQSQKSPGRPHPSFYLPMTKLGTLQQNYVFRQWKSLIDDFGQVVKEDGKRVTTKVGAKRLLTLLRHDPVLRIKAARNAPGYVKEIANRLGDPLNPVNRYHQVLRDLQLEFAHRKGVDPIVLAREYDQYLTQMFADVARGTFDIEAAMRGTFTQKNLKRAIGIRQVRTAKPKDVEARLNKAILEGDLSVEKLMADTVAAVSMQMDMMTHFSERAKVLIDNDLASRKPREGWKQIPRTQVRRGVSGGEYNFLMGEMAGLWVRPEVAKTLGYTRAALKRSNRVLQAWKMVSTVYNVPGYSLRNHVGDMLNVWAQTGINPFRGDARAIWKEAFTHHMEQAGFGRGRKGPVKPTRWYLEHMEDGITDSENLHLDLGNTAVDKASNMLAERMANATKNAESIADVVEVPTMLQMQLNGLKDFGALVGGSVRGGFKRHRRVIRAAWKEWQDARGYGWKEGTKAVTNAALDQFLAELSDTALVKWTRAYENARRSYTALLAERKLGIADRKQRASFVAETMHDYGDRPEWLMRWQKSGFGQAVLPPFLTYGWKQARFTARRALNDPELFVYNAMYKAMKAYREQQHADDPMSQRDANNDRDFMSRMRLSSMSPFGADRFLIDNAHDVSEALQDMGWSKAARAAAKAGDMTLTMPLRDIANLNTMLNDFKPSAKPWETLSRMNPAVDMAFAALDPNAWSQAHYEGAPPATNKAYAASLQRLNYIAKAFVPWHPGGYTAKSWTKAAKAILGEDEYTKYGEPITIFEAVRPMLGASPVSGISPMNTIRRLDHRMKAELRNFRAEAGRYKATLNTFDPDDLPLWKEAQIDAVFGLFKVKMNMMNKMVPGSVSRGKYLELEKLRRAAVKRLLAEGEVAPASLSLGTLPVTVEPLDRAIQGVMTEELDVR